MVEMDDFEEAIDRVVAGLEKRNRLMNPKEKEIVAYHETGHALVAEALPTTDKVHRVSIIPRGIGALGYTMQLPTEDRYLMTKTELEDRMAVMMGGRVAEELVFQEISTGAQNDLYRASEIARSMIREYGMSEKLGPMTFERERRPMFLEVAINSSKDYSESTAQEIDQEVWALIDRAHRRAREVLEKERGVLEKTAKILLEKEVLEGEELREILNSAGKPEPPGKEKSHRKVSG
jgi:cell division protease FtsH